MEFFDCNTYIGRPSMGHLAPVAGVAELLRAMDRAGIARALVWHVAQHDLSPLVGNGLLAEAIASQERLVGCWAMIPNQARELGPTEEWFERMARANVRAVRAFPQDHRYLLRRESVGDILDGMVQRKIPLILSLKRGVSWDAVYNLLAEFPDLLCIISETGCWGSDRWFRPLLERYPNVYIDMSDYLLDGGIEALVRDYGAGRMLFGTGFPDQYHGGMMLALKHAEIAQDERDAIASGNLERILCEVEL